MNGDSGMSLESFRRHARLKTGAKVEHDTVNRALNGVLKEYRNQKRLEAVYQAGVAVLLRAPDELHVHGQ